MELPQGTLFAPVANVPTLALLAKTKQQ